MKINTPILFPAMGAVSLLIGAIAWEERYHFLMRNVRVVEPGRIYRGALQRPIPLRRLIRRYDIRTILSLRGPCAWEEQIAREMGVEWISAPVDARAYMRDTSRELQAAVEVLGDNSKEPIFFHCDRGIDRSSLVQAAYRMTADGWTLEQAIAEVQQAGLYPKRDTSLSRRHKILAKFYDDRVVQPQRPNDLIRTADESHKSTGTGTDSR